MRFRISTFLLVLGLAGCGDSLPNPFVAAPKEDPIVDEPAVQVPAPDEELVIDAPEGVEIGGEGQSAETLDTTTDAEREAATEVASSGGSLGTTVASLGDPSKPGFWLETPLVKSETSGIVEAANGKRVNVTLIPIPGEATAGSRISLSAMRALDLDLTSLPTVSVFSG